VIPEPQEPYVPEDVSLVVGTSSDPVDLDPQVARDSASIDAIDQVCEGLFAYDLSDPEMAIIPNLAFSGTWNPVATEFTCILRQGVTFHDGTHFDADAVIFMWDRMAWALNTTGTNTVGITQVAELYEFPNGTPIVKEVIKNSNYSVTFELNGPYVPFEALLCFSASYILSPLSTPAMEYIDTATGEIVGTGPFVYNNYAEGFNVTFHAFDDYWKGRSQIDKLIFSIFPDANARDAALFTGHIDILPDPQTSSIRLIWAAEGLDVAYGGSALETQYFGMNNKQINSTVREAISYAIDYNYLVYIIGGYDTIRIESPIPEGILYANWEDFSEARENVAHARTVMQSMGFGVGWNVTVDGTDENKWQTATFLTFNYTYNIGYSYQEDTLSLLQDNLEKIGIAVEDAGMTLGDFNKRMYGIGNHTRNMLQIYWHSWSSEYNDPNTYVNPLLTNRSAAHNGAQYNGYTAAIEAGRDPMALNDNVQLLMEAGLSEPNRIARKAIYDRIQELLIEHDRPWIFGYVSIEYDAWVSNLHGYQSNPMGKKYFHPCYFT